jgi:hypothetical protein
MKASRLARLVGADEVHEWLTFELRGVPGNDRGRQHMTHTGRWTDQEEDKGYWSSVADLESFVETSRAQLAASQIESLSGDMILPATSELRRHQGSIAGAITKVTRVINQVRAATHTFAYQTYYELLFSKRQRSLFEQAREEIDGLLAPAGGEALSKIDSIYRRLDEGDREAVSQAMNTCRRLIDDFADTVYPPQDEPVDLDGREVQVTTSHTQNRINIYFASHVKSHSRRDRIRRSLSDIYDRVSAGVHRDVTIQEARYLFLSTYILLVEILSAGQPTPEPPGEGGADPA